MGLGGLGFGDDFHGESIQHGMFCVMIHYNCILLLYIYIVSQYIYIYIHVIYTLYIHTERERESDSIAVHGIFFNIVLR